MLKKERSRSPRKRMAGHLPRDAGTGRRGEVGQALRAAGARKGLPGTAGAEERHKKHAFARGWDITGQKRVFYRVL